MRLTIVYDNEVFEENPNLKSDWGFSCFIEGKEKILFDTGTRGDILVSNMKALNVDPREINKIVISHEHFDHNGGLGEVLKHTKDVE
ncbi:MAG: MBL fold hydrolase, partial [Thermoplasmata archaeon]